MTFTEFTSQLQSELVPQVQAIASNHAPIGTREYEEKFLLIILSSFSQGLSSELWLKGNRLYQKYRATHRV